MFWNFSPNKNRKNLIRIKMGLMSCSTLCRTENKADLSNHQKVDCGKYDVVFRLSATLPNVDS